MKNLNAMEVNPPVQRRRNLIVPALFTTANIFAGFYATMMALKGYQVVQTDWEAAARFFDSAAKAIGWAVLFDALDGRIARMTNGASEFGMELDSLADVISFGIAPAVLAFAWGYGSAPPAYNPHFTGLAWAVSFTYLMCGAFRLARFNVHARRPIPDSKKDRKQFVGLPIPAAAGLIAAIVHFVKKPILAAESRGLGLFGQIVQLDSSLWSLALLLLVFGLGLLMISTVRHTSFKTLGFSRLSPRLTFLLLSLTVCGIYWYSRWVLLSLAIAYASHGILSRVIGRLLRWYRKERPLREPAPKESL
ncbi:MAG: CDP-alcohol phosphatidyltransferase family protein [Acidobacteria bacterium]|nr:CDP-alcohol phosphatidyltransferase family protein [Acidobacteriota bacterium]